MPDCLIIAITGASGAIYGLRALHLARQLALETHLTISPAARLTLTQETGTQLSDVLALASVVHEPHDIAASIASGSFLTRGMLVAPCSIKTLSAIANSFADDLIVRAADVCLKEGRPLLLMVRETPLHRGHLRLMDQAAAAGAIIFPPVPAFYGKPESLQDIIDASVGRALMRMGFDNPAYTRWTGL
jgi:4-hydroxy-3-polyprenylbenzoate decarboxylase